MYFGSYNGLLYCGLGASGARRSGRSVPAGRSPAPRSSSAGSPTRADAREHRRRRRPHRPRAASAFRTGSTSRSRATGAAAPPRLLPPLRWSKHDGGEAALAALAVVLLLGGAPDTAYVLIREHQERDVRGSSTVEFVTTDVPETRVPPKGARHRLADVRLRRAARRRVSAVPASTAVPSPLAVRRRHLLEFPPAIGYGRLFFSNNAGRAVRGRRAHRQRAWRYRSGRCVAASPAVRTGLVFQTFLNRPPCNAEAGWRARRGGRRVLRGLGQDPLAQGRSARASRRRSSGTAASTSATGTEHLGAERQHGREPLDVPARTARSRARSRASGPPVRRLVRPPRLRARRARRQADLGARRRERSAARPTSTRPRRWPTAASTSARPTGRSTRSAPRAGSSAGRTTPAATSTPRPAVYDERVYVGSYSGKFYASTRRPATSSWQFEANGPISGSATVIDGIVYFRRSKSGRTRSTRARASRSGRSPTASTRRSWPTAHRLYLSATPGSMAWSNADKGRVGAREVRTAKKPPRKHRPISTPRKRSTSARYWRALAGALVAPARRPRHRG